MGVGDGGDVVMLLCRDDLSGPGSSYGVVVVAMVVIVYSRVKVVMIMVVVAWWCVRGGMPWW